MRKTGETRLCEQCGKEKYFAAWQLRDGEGRFCSRACKAIGQTGKRLADTNSRHVRPDGYIQVYIGFGETKLEHRIVMEATLGRPLVDGDVIHHLNHDRADNRPENLALMTNASHGKHHGGRPSQKVTLVCQACGSEYERKPGRVAESHFCSNACRMPAMHAARREQAAIRREGR